MLSFNALFLISLKIKNSNGKNKNKKPLSKPVTSDPNCLRDPRPQTQAKSVLIPYLKNAGTFTVSTSKLGSLHMWH
jgi:hypothetical protein